MSSDDVRWCENDNDDDRCEYECIHASHKNDVNDSYTFLPVHRHSRHGKDFSYDDQISVINIRNKHSNYRDSRHKLSVERHANVAASLLTGCRRQFLRIYSRNFCLLTTLALLHVLCNILVSSVSCEALIDAVGTRNHYTHTWAVHIPGGEDVARQVANEHGMNFRGKIIDDHYHLEHRSIAKRSVSPSDHHQRRLIDDHRVAWSQQQQIKSRQKRDFLRGKTNLRAKLLNDPKWTNMWYLNRGEGLDMNVIPAWRDGITGKNIVVTILDDGLETDHPDLERNYDPEASWDVNGHDADPMPHYDMTDSNRHGTRCAGEVAATANNSLCAVGIAFNAKVGGVRMLDGDVTDAVEAQSLGLNPQHIDIYSASWGPDDDGKTVDGPGEMATKAFIDGVTKGRSGKGSIFVWASGNGGREQDNCNCDGYTNSIWTLSISSATEYGDIPWYSEKCSSTLATTYSSGQQNEKQVVTTDLHHMCTSSHTGTSASAPLAAGIVALALEANPNLTWRDMQHIVVRTANPANLGKVANEWAVNGVGRKVSHSFGYGLMDAAAMVRLSRVWETVPEQQRCEIHSPHLDKPIPPRRNVTFQLKVDHCKGVNYLEHVQARITLTTQRRGDIVIYLTSPSGTRTCLLTERVHDVSRSGFGDWPFMTVHQWGEAPHGVWELEIHNKGRYMEFALIRSWCLILYGTAAPVQHDDIRQSSSPPYNNNTIYRIKSQNKRKQQQSQKSTTISSGSTLTSTRKNGGKQKNKNGKNNQRMSSTQTSTTTRPLTYTTAMLNQFSIDAQIVKSKGGGKFNQSKSTSAAMSTSTTTIMRPRPTTKLPIVMKSNNGNNNLHSSSKLDQKYSNIYEKSSSGKAPKQVKESSYSPKPIPSTVNPSILQMFERYEKIQEIFPELEPQREIHHNPVYFTVSNGKPSRENSKSFSSFVSFDSNIPQKKNTPNDRSESTRQRDSESGKGQITQWNLIFYGTSEPSQKNDPPRYLGNNKKTVVNDLIHNSLDNSQWGFITQDVADMGTHSDVQRTVDDDLTSSACLNFTDNNKSFCLECAAHTFIFNGRCFNSCPDHSYIVQEKASENALKRRGMNNNRELFDGSLEDIIGRTESMRNRATALKLCGSCHESCLKCKGPTERDCITCETDYYQIIIGSEITCRPTTMSSTKSASDGITNQLKSYSIEKIVLISSAIGILLMITCICIYLLCIKCDGHIFTSICERWKQLMGKASNLSASQEKYSYNIVEMEDTPLTLPRLDVNDDDSDASV